MEDNINKKKWYDNIDWKKWTDPVTFLVIAILISIFVLIAWNLPGMLNNLRNRDFARGLITYLFAVGTIGAIAVSLLYALLNRDSESNHFAHAKDLLSILIGVFGTIIGYYFGADTGANAKLAEMKIISISKPDDSLLLNKKYSFSAVINGGTYPYNYDISIAGKSVANGYTGGLIKTDITLDSSFAAPASSSDIILKVTDNNDKTITYTEKHFIVKDTALKK